MISEEMNLLFDTEFCRINYKNVMNPNHTTYL